VKIYNFSQYSPEWWRIREKRLTASKAQAIGNCGIGLESYVDEKMSEYYSSAEKEPTFTSKDTQRGLDLEPVAATIYEMEYGVTLQEIGFVVHNDYVGGSPDRLEDEEGLAEIKCPNDKTFWILKKTEKVDSGYIWQMNMQMLICKKRYCKFVAYNPNYYERRLKIKDCFFIKTFTPDPKKVEKLKKGFETGERLIRDADARYKK